MAVSTRRVSVTTDPTRLDAAPTDNQPGHSIMAVAQASGTLYIGDSAVTTSTGCRVPVVAGTTISVDLGQTVTQPGVDTAVVEGIYATVASSTLAVDVLITGG